MILVGQYDSPYVRRVAIALHLLDLPFERNTLSAFGDAEAMRRINPLGRIPSLVLDDGEVLIDSVAILDHLDEQVGPERALLPPRGVERRRALQLTALASGTLDKAGAVTYERSLRPAEKVHEPWIARCRTQLESGLAALEALTGGGWYLGDRVRTPDIMAACLMWYLTARVPEALAGGAHPHLGALHARCGELAAFRDTEPSPEELMPGAPL
jgi:glutathione S-transferase